MFISWVKDLMKQWHNPHCLIADMQDFPVDMSVSYRVCSWSSLPENELPPGFAPQCPSSPFQNHAVWWGQIVGAASMSPHCWSQCLSQEGTIISVVKQIIHSLQAPQRGIYHNSYILQTLTFLCFWRWQIDQSDQGTTVYFQNKINDIGLSIKRGLWYWSQLVLAACL